MTHTIIELPYAFNDLEPYIDAKTMEIHYTKHHQAYCDNLNKALQGSNHSDREVADLLGDLDSVPENIRNAVKNNGGGLYNHNLFWEIMKKDGGGAPTGELASQINNSFGDFDKFKNEFSAAALTRFGSGWAWLTVNQNGRLEIFSTANQDCPLSDHKIPILALDVWEHAYYLHYQNRRAEYIDKWWNVVNWEKVAANFETAIS